MGLINEAKIIDQEIDLRFNFKGKYCYVNVCRDGIDSPLFRLTYVGDLEHWEYATAKYNSPNDSTIYVYAGNPRDRYTLERSIQLSEDIHWHML